MRLGYAALKALTLFAAIYFSLYFGKLLAPGQEPAGNPYTAGIYTIIIFVGQFVFVTIVYSIIRREKEDDKS